MRRPYLRSTRKDRGWRRCDHTTRCASRLQTNAGRTRRQPHTGDTMKFKKLTPNLVVRDVTASMEFYRSVLGFEPAIKVPDEPPFVFGSVTSGGVEIFFNDRKAVAEDYPALGAKPIGGSLTLFIEVEDIEAVMAAVEKSGARITMPLKEQFYGMREFAFEDPEGWVVT